MTYKKYTFVDEILQSKNHRNSTDYQGYIKYLEQNYKSTQGKKPIFIMTAGPPGVGKSTFIQKVIKKLHMKKENFILLNPDDLRLYNKDFRDAITGVTYKKKTTIGKKKKWNLHADKRLHQSGYVDNKNLFYSYKNATLITLRDVRNSMQDKVLPYFWKSGKNIIFDTSCYNANFCASYFNNATNKGYTTVLLGVHASREVAKVRAQKRQYTDGRYMTDIFLKDSYFSARTSYDNIIKKSIKMDRNYFFNNDANRIIGKKIRKHKGINQVTGKLKKGYKYSGKKLKSGLPQIIKVV